LVRMTKEQLEAKAENENRVQENVDWRRVLRDRDCARRMQQQREQHAEPERQSTDRQTMMSRGPGRIPRQKPEGRTSLSRTALAPHFALAARHVNHKNVPLKPIARRGGASSQGEVYDYYERPGMLNVYFATFHPVDSPPVNLPSNPRSFSYLRSSGPSPMATPEIVPSNFPVLVRNWAPPAALNNTGITVAVNVRVPDARFKRLVPRVIS
jgi:hypothetical protein